jgi:putative glutamine amidotransferase
MQGVVLDGLVLVPRIRFAAIAALERNLPVLAVCRGMQRLAAALGGKLYQSISELPPDLPCGEHIVHRSPGHNDTTHPVRVDSRTLAPCGCCVEWR